MWFLRFELHFPCAVAQHIPGVLNQLPFKRRWTPMRQTFALMNVCETETEPGIVFERSHWTKVFGNFCRAFGLECGDFSQSVCARVLCETIKGSRLQRDLFFFFSGEEMCRRKRKPCCNDRKWRCTLSLFLSFPVRSLYPAGVAIGTCFLTLCHTLEACRPQGNGIKTDTCHVPLSCSAFASGCRAFHLLPSCRNNCVKVELKTKHHPNRNNKAPAGWTKETIWKWIAERACNICTQ